MKKLRYDETKEFKKDFKRLLKRFKTLNDDFGVAKKSAVALFHELGIDNRSVFELSGYSLASATLYKLRKFSCRALKGRGANTGIRLIYAFYPEDFRVEFIEIYFKGDKELEDFGRLKRYCGGS